MSEKKKLIFVKCPTRDIWDKVSIKMDSSMSFRKNAGLYPKEGTWSDLQYAIRQGYTIITAEEYLEEVKDEVRKFGWGIFQGKVIPREIVESDNPKRIYCQHINCLEVSCGSCIKQSTGKTSNIYKKYLGQKTTNKPTTTKEEVMNTIIEEVFKDDTSTDEKLMQKHFGAEIADNFTGKLLLKANKEAYLSEAGKREDAEKEAAKK